MHPSDLIYNDGEVFRQSPVALSTLQNYGVANNPVDILFANFVAYAAVNWSYGTTSDAAAQGLIDSTVRTVTACATIADAFRLLVKQFFPDLPQSRVNLDSSTAKGHFLVKPGLKCFDPKVIGNIGNKGAELPSEFGIGTHFSTHYMAKVGIKYYDPCLMATYISPDGPILLHTKVKSLGPKNPVGIRKMGSGLQLKFIVPEQKPVPGFDSRLHLLLPKEMKSILDKEGFETLKNDSDVKLGRFF